MQNIEYSSNKKGFVLSLVLWISAAMMLLSLLFVRMTKEQTETYGKMHKKLEIELLSQSLFEQICFYISTSKFQSNKVLNTFDDFPPALYIDRTEYNVTKNNSTCFYSIFDHSGIYNIRYLTADAEAEKMVQHLSAKKYPFRDIYLDWLDGDIFARVNGAERSSYLSAGYRYVPSNYISFQHKDSIYLLKDFNKFDNNSISNIRKYFTPYGSVPVNILLFDKVMLRSFFPNINQKEAEYLISLIKSNQVEYEKYFIDSGYSSIETYSLFSSKVMTISIKCKQEDLTSKLKAIVNFKPTNTRSWAILEVNK